MNCYCGSVREYASCCQPLHQGALKASPQALMRSRFSAFVLGLDDYLLRTWAPDTRPGQLDLADQPQWKRLEVLSESVMDEVAEVHFLATGLEQGRWLVLEERSRFVRNRGGWLYLTGDCQHHTLAPGRNDPCPCGTGRKYKKCCGR